MEYLAQKPIDCKYYAGVIGLFISYKVNIFTSNVPLCLSVTGTEGVHFLSLALYNL